MAETSNASTTKFPIDSPDALYGRGLRNESDIYVVESGPNETRGWGRVALFHVEVPVNGGIDEGKLSEHMKVSQGADPQSPRLLGYEEMAERLAGYEALCQQEEKEKTEEFEVLTGTHVLPSV